MTQEKAFPVGPVDSVQLSSGLSQVLKGPKTLKSAAFKKHEKDSREVRFSLKSSFQAP